VRGSSDSFETSDIGVLFDLARRIAARWTASAADAEDLAQEAIIRYLTAPSPPANPPAWFHVVIRRVSNRHRLRRAARESAEEAFSTQRVTGQTQSDLTIELQQLLACVNDRERRVFGLLVSGAQSREIAAAFGCHVRDVGQIVSRARRSARKLTGRDERTT